MLKSLSRMLVLIVLVAWCWPFGCRRSPVGNGEDRRIAEITSGYFSGKKGEKCFVDLSDEEKSATVGLLRSMALPGVTLLFFNIDRAGQFSPINGSGSIDAELASCGLTTDETARVKNQVKAQVAPNQPVPEGVRKHLQTSDQEMRKQLPGSVEARLPREPGGIVGGSRASFVLNSSRCHVRCITGFMDDQVGYRAACCLILSPTVHK